MSDAYNDSKADNMQVRRDRHPSHFATADVGAKEDFFMPSKYNSMLQEVMTAAEPAPAAAIKNDAGKTEYHHLPPQAFEEVNKVLTFGAKKYSAYNYRAGFSHSRLFNAAMRHMWAYWRGEDRDPETGLSHLAHACCCMLIMLQNVLETKGTDDRYKEGLK